MPEFQKVSVGEVSLRIAIEGEGPLVVMVHGFPEFLVFLASSNPPHRCRGLHRLCDLAISNFSSSLAVVVLSNPLYSLQGRTTWCFACMEIFSLS